MHWTELPLHLIDFEGNREYGIVEYGVATLLGGRVAGTKTRLCRPTGIIRPEDIRLHGIREVDTLELALFADDWETFVKLRKDGPLGAHHAVVEINLLKAVWPYPPYSPDFRQSGRELADWGPWIDTRRLFATLFPSLENHKLRDLVQTFDLQNKLDSLAREHCPAHRRKYHCALYDALAAALLLIHLCGQSGFEKTTVQWLLDQSSSRPQEDRQEDLF